MLIILLLYTNPVDDHPQQMNENVDKTEALFSKVLAANNPMNGTSFSMGDATFGSDYNDNIDGDWYVHSFRIDMF